MSDNPSTLVGIPGAKAKPTRKQRRAANQLQHQQTQLAEVAAASGIPPTLVALQAAQADAENRAALASAEGGSSLLARGEDSTSSSRIGRPSEYTEERGDSLCAWIACGGSLRAWCREHGVAADTVYRWLRQDARFHERYACAHEDRADTLADEMIEIADEAAQDASIEGVAAAKLRVETRRWIASKMGQSKWGDKTVVQHHGAVSIRIGIPQKVAPEVVDIASKPAKLT